MNEMDIMIELINGASKRFNHVIHVQYESGITLFTIYEPCDGSDTLIEEIETCNIRTMSIVSE